MRINTQRFQEELLRSGLKQKDLAEMVGVTEVTISRYANGTREPKRANLLKIANILNTTADYLAGIDIDYHDYHAGYLNVVNDIRAYAKGWTTAQKRELIILVSDFIQ